jgi:1-acyl-sn-glycerol-3-phosphate acyltransferase
MPAQEINLFVLRRKDWIVNLSKPVVKLATLYHRVTVEGAEYLPRQGPALLLVKHRATRDSILLSEILYRHTGRMGNYLMKGKPTGLKNSLLEALGGIKVVRPKDIYKLKSRDEKKARLAWAREYNQRAYNYVAWLYTQSEIVIAYPEGMFFGHRLGPIQSGIIKHTLAVEQAHDLQIPITPIGIEYQSLHQPRSRAYFRIGSPLSSTSFANPRDLTAEVKQQLAWLSGLATNLH